MATRPLTLVVALALWSAPVHAQEQVPSGADVQPSKGVAVEGGTVETPPPPASPEEGGAVMTGRDAAMVSAFRDAALRYQARMDEFTGDVQIFLDDREYEERRALSEGYDKLIDTLDDLERTKRVLTVEKFEDFLRLYPDVEYASHVRFRLAEMYYEEDYEAWEERLAKYDRLADAAGDDLGKLEDLGDSPRKDFARSVALYERIVEDNRKLPADRKYEYLDGAYYMLAYVLSGDTVQADEDRYQLVLREMIETLPESKLADQARLYIGLYHFNRNEIPQAIEQFTTIFEKGREQNLYFEAMYQLAWSYYKLSEYDQALSLFVSLLEQSDLDYKEKGKHSDYRRDAIKYMAISYLDMADADEAGRNPNQIAVDYFASHPGENRSFEWEVFKELANTQIEYNRIDDAIVTLAYLQEEPRWRLRPENPEFQAQIGRIVSRSLYAPPDAVGESRKVLAERYHEGSEWWEANRHNPEATAKVRAVMESSLADLATDYRRKADELAGLDPADPSRKAAYLGAALKYQEYLDNFPISDNFYEMQFYMADSFLNAQEWEAAEREYMALIRTSEQHAFGDIALVSLLQARMALATLTLGDPGLLPEGAVELGKRTTAWGREIPYYEIGAMQRGLIEAIDMVLTHRFGVVESDYTEANRAWVAESRAALAYMAGQIYFHHGYYDEARKRFVPVIDRYRRTEYGSYSARLLVDSYVGEGDLANVRKWSSDFARNPVGGEEDQSANIKTFASLEENTAFKQAYGFVTDAVALEKDGNHEAAWPIRLEAADAFLKFIEDFPQAENASMALYNAANSLQIAGQPERANELFELYVNKYPDDDRSKLMYFRIASNYETTFEFNKAIGYYERLVRLFPDSPDASAAQYNAALLKIGIGDNRGAALGYEGYAEKFPDAPDAEETYFLAAAEWEKVSEADAMKFYDRYLKKYGMKASPPHAFEAMYRKAVIYKKQNKDKLYNEQLDQIDEVFSELTQAGVNGGMGAHYAAEAGFRSVQAEYEAYMKREMLPNTMKNQEANAILLNETLLADLKAFGGTVASFVPRYSDQEYTSAVLYMRAMATLRYGQIGAGWGCPTDMDEDLCMAFQEVWDEHVLPQFEGFEQKGQEELVNLIKSSENLGFYNSWIDQALVALNKANPTDWPAQKVDRAGRVDSSILPTIKPIYPEGMEPSPVKPPPSVVPPAAPEAATSPVTEGGEQ